MPEAVVYLLTHYEEICRNTSAEIRLSGLPQKHFYLALGMSRATFDRRLRQHDWRPEELGKLMEMVEVRGAPRQSRWKWFRRIWG